MVNLITTISFLTTLFLYSFFSDKNNFKSKFVINLHTQIAKDTFPNLDLETNCFTKKNLPSGAKDKVKCKKNSVYYNNSILEDTQMLEHLKLISYFSKSTKSFADSVILFKIWLKQKNMEKFATFNSFLIQLLICYLLHNKTLNKSMSSYQIFKLTLLFLSQHPPSQPIFFDFQPSPNLQNLLTQNFPFVFVLSTSALNVASHLTKSGFLHLQNYAKSTLQLFQSNYNSSFDLIFLSKPSPFLTSDLYLV